MDAMTFVLFGEQAIKPNARFTLHYITCTGSENAEILLRYRIGTT